MLKLKKKKIYIYIYYITIYDFDPKAKMKLNIGRKFLYFSKYITFACLTTIYLSFTTKTLSCAYNGPKVVTIRLVQSKSAIDFFFFFFFLNNQLLNISKGIQVH